MLRSAKSVSINHSKITSNNGIIISPVIVLNGLVVRGDQITPPAILSFLEAHNVRVGRLRYQGSTLVALSGGYQLTAEAIARFISENQEIVDAQKQGLDDIQFASNFKEAICAQVDAPFPREVRVDNAILTVPLISSKMVLLKAETRLVNGGGIIAEEDIEATAQAHLHQGYVSRGVGHLATAMAKGKISFFGSLLAANASIQSGEELKIDSDPSLPDSEVSLAMATDVRWVNDPTL